MGNVELKTIWCIFWQYYCIQYCNVQCYPNPIPMDHFHKIKYFLCFILERKISLWKFNNSHFNPLISRDLSPRKRLLLVLFFIFFYELNLQTLHSHKKKKKKWKHSKNLMTEIWIDLHNLFTHIKCQTKTRLRTNLHFC